MRALGAAAALVATLCGTAAAAKHSYVDGDNVKLWANVGPSAICVDLACMHHRTQLTLECCCAGGGTFQQPQARSPALSSHKHLAVLNGLNKSWAPLLLQSWDPPFASFARCLLALRSPAPNYAEEVVSVAPVLSVPASASEQHPLRAPAGPDPALLRSVTYQYYERLPFCQPPDGRLVHKPATLGELVDGNRLVLTPYDIAFMRNRERAALCTKALTRAEVQRFQAVRGRRSVSRPWLQLSAAGGE